MLTDLAERHAEVTLATRTRQLIGRVVGVAQDFCVVEERSGATMLVAMTAVATLSPVPGTARHDFGAPTRPSDPSGARNPPLTILWVDAMAMLAAERSPVRLAVSSGELLLGDLVAVGTDVVTLQGDQTARGNGPAKRGQTYVPLAAIEVCTPR